MREKEFEIHIVDEKSNTFDAENNMFGKGDEYIIPLYQRAYAWEDKQLIQLIEDIKDIDYEKVSSCGGFLSAADACLFAIHVHLER